MTTIRDVARQANVAPSTVSQVLNRRGNISQKTIEKVENAVRQINYRPQRIGRPSLRNDTMVIGVIYSQTVVSNGAISSLSRTWINGMREAITNNNGHMNLLAGSVHVQQDLMFQQMVEAGELNGVVLIGNEPKDGYLDCIAQSGIPYVVMNRRPKRDAFSHVTMDNYGGGRQAAAYLLDKGHRRIALITGPDEYDYAQDRLDGARDELTEHDLEPVTVQRLDSHGTPEHVQQICQAIVDAKATAVFGNDDHMVRCLDVWLEMGIDIPGQLSLVGFDDVGTPTASGMRPTSVGFDKHLMGKQAVNMLLSMIDMSPQVRSMSAIFSTQLAEHDTTAAPPHEA